MRTRAVVGAVVAAGLVSVPATALAATSTTQSSPQIIQVCLTVTPKSISISINGQPIIGQTAGLPRTCVGV